MVSPKILLQKLQPYKKENIILVNDQTVGDIINGIIKTHGKYADQYDKILPYFEDDDIVETAKNIFDFLKQNCKYVIESDLKQTLRSPAAIIATGNTMGCDCKSYSLMFGGLLSAYKRKYKTDDKLYYRFAGYNGKDLQHVFVVLDCNGQKYWCDAVLDYFNDRSKIPSIIKDKNMALISMAGIGNNISQQIQDYTSIGKSRMVFGIGENTQSDQSGNSTDWAAIAQQIFSLFGKRSDPTDYQRWDGLDQKDGNPKGLQAAYWATHDGDDAQNEASNVLAYIQMAPNNIQDMIKAAAQRLGMDERAFLGAMKAKLERFANVPPQIRNSTLDQFINLIKGITGGGGSGSGSGDGSGGGSGSNTQTAGFSPLLILALIGAGAAFFLKRKK
jgi:hypothetical protein